MRRLIAKPYRRTTRLEYDLESLLTNGMHTDTSVSNLTLSSDNAYIPILALTTYRSHFNADRTTRVLEYGIIKPMYGNNTRRFISFCERLRFPEEGGYQNDYYTSIKGAALDVNRAWFATDGQILYRPNANAPFEPILQMCVRREHLFDIRFNDLGSVINFNPSHFCLLIDKKFNDDPENFKVFRNVKKLYIDEVYKSGIDILYTNSIINLCYKPVVEPMPRFNTLSEAQQYSSVINTQVSSIVRDFWDRNNPTVDEEDEEIDEDIIPVDEDAVADELPF